MIDNEKISRYYRLNNLVRYSQMSRVDNESVATHSYYVALFSLMICEKLELDDYSKCKAMKMALVHDLPEMYTSDIPSIVKQSSDKLVELLDQLEEEIVSMHFSEYKDEFNTLDDKSNLLTIIVKLADILSVAQYSYHESRLGNATMSEVLQDANNRYSSKLKDLKNLYGIDFTDFDM